MTITSIHVYTNEQLNCHQLEFRSFSREWQTCVTDLTDSDDNYLYDVARSLSKTVPAPVLLFSIFDSDAICFHFFKNGKRVASYFDDEFSQSDHIYSIPALVGYGDGYKKRLSKILSSSDAEEKTQLLEEYFGVGLLPFQDIITTEPEALRREKGEVLYNEYLEREEAISGKRAPVTAKLIAEYKGKIFYDIPGGRTKKEHCYLFGYESNSKVLHPVRFCGDRLEDISSEEFNKDRINKYSPRFYDTEFRAHVCYTVFNELAPEPYRNRSMILPSGFYPCGFDGKGRLILDGQSKICIVNGDLKIIAKISIKGDVAEIMGDYILTSSGDSFCGYVYEPKAAVRIYKLTEKEE